MRKEIINIMGFFGMAMITIGFNVWPVFIPYYYSYLKNFNPYITVEQVFGTTFFLYLGMNAISAVMPIMLYLFGMRGTIVACGVITFLNCFCLHYFTSWFFICLNVLIFGGLYRYTTLVSIIYFSETYPQKASHYYGLALSGFLVGSLLSNNLCCTMINPNNQPMSQTTDINGYTEQYFEFEIASRVVSYLNFYGVFSLLMCIMCSFLVSDLDKYPGEWRIFLGWVFGEDHDIRKSIDRFKNNLDETFTHSFRQSEANPITKSLSYSMKSNAFAVTIIKKLENAQENEEDAIEQMLTANQSPEEIAEIEYQRQKKSITFWVLLFIGIARNAQPCFLLENFKVQAFCVINDDMFLTRTFSLTAFTGVIGNISASYIWDAIGMVNANYLAICINLVIDILLMTVAPHSPVIFMSIIFFARAYSSYDVQVNNMTMFSMFDSMVALKLSKIFDFNFFFAICIAVVFNFYLVYGCSYKMVYFCFFILEVVALLLIYKYLDKKSSDTKP